MNGWPHSSKEARRYAYLFALPSVFMNTSRTETNRRGEAL